MRAAVSIILNAIGKDKFSHLKSNIMLKSHIEELMKANGELTNVHVGVRYGDQELKLVLVVVQGDGPSLFGLKHEKLSKMSNCPCCRSSTSLCLLKVWV